MRDLKWLVAAAGLALSGQALAMPWDLDMVDAETVKAYERAMAPLPAGVMSQPNLLTLLSSLAQRAGVNPTAAAIGTLKCLGKLDAAEHSQTAEFLAEMQSDEGGLTANTRIPFADLLSTFTGLLTLTDLNATSNVNVDAMERYALSMQSPGGGFVGFSLDQIADVEYSFYGVATISLCQLMP